MYSFCMGTKKLTLAQRKFWTVHETAEQLSVSPNHIYRMVQQGNIKKIDSRIIGNRILIPKKQFEEEFPDLFK